MIKSAVFVGEDIVMIVDSNRRILGNSFLSEVILTEPENARQAGEFEPAWVAESIDLCFAQGAPVVVCNADQAARATRSALSFPIFRGRTMRSILSFVVHSPNTSQAAGAVDPTGVFEVWSPQGLFQDLGLTSGYFGKLDRFHNVSSFVRFEQGSGLPGQTWSLGRTVIHDNLKTHPGFLRAAGASADSLQTAVGIPIIASNFIASVVLISSLASPIAQAFEVWQPTHNGFELLDRAYNGLAESCQLPLGACLPGTGGLLGSVVESQDAVLTDDVAALWTDRRLESDDAVSCRAVAIPTYVDNELSCVTVLVL